MSYQSLVSVKLYHRSTPRPIVSSFSMKNKFVSRFHELQHERSKLKFVSVPDTDLVRVLNGQWMGWATSAQSLIRAVFGENSPQYLNFSKVCSNCSGFGGEVWTLFSLFDAAKSDFEGGYVFDVDLRVSGEVFGDFVALARHSLSEGNRNVAAVLACAALEDALKRYAVVNELAVEGKSMADVVNALKSAGLVAGAQKTLLDAMPRIRNLALHGDWAKLSDPDVASVLGFVESFLLNKFSP